MRSRLLLAALLVPLALASACGEEGSSDAGEEATGVSDSASPTPTEAPSDPASASPTESASATSKPPEPTGPACSAVWVDGRSLPKRYQGCVDDTGFVKADRLGCSSGQRIIRYDDRYWAYEGGPVSKTRGLAKDAEYADEVATCRG